MTTLSIEFDPRRLSAKIAVSDPGVAWESIRRACEDHSDEVVVEGSNSLEMPWWAFLGCRSAVGYYVSRFGLELHVDDQTRDVLKVAAETEAVIRNAEELPSLPEADVLAHLAEAGFARQLKTFQLRNLAQLSRLDVGATFSVPGAGKTTEAIAFYCLRRRPDSRLLVICPKNAFAAWEEQLAICLPASPHKFVRLVGGATAIRREVDREPHLTLMTYQQFPNVRRIVTAYLDRYPNMIFLDESHRIKRGADGKIANAILRVAPIANVRLIMSGTPLPNAVSDLVPQAKFIVPQAIVDEDTVRDFIRPLYVRTRKSELLLPPISRAVVTISMAPAQRRLYELMRSEIARQADELLSMRDRRALRRFGRSAMTLLQFTSNPALLARRPFAYEELLADVLEEGDSPKLAFACWRARILASQHHKIIIWSSFVENVEVIADRLADLGADLFMAASKRAMTWRRIAERRRFEGFTTTLEHMFWSQIRPHVGKALVYTLFVIMPFM